MIDILIDLNIDKEPYIKTLTKDKIINLTGQINKELGEMFREKYNTLPNCADNFDLIYQDILNYCKDLDKIIVIDCAQFHCIKDISLLKGTVIIIRTSINTCYNRCIERFKDQNPNYTEEKLKVYAERKKKIFVWYKQTNDFILKVDKL